MNEQIKKMRKIQEKMKHFLFKLKTQITDRKKAGK